jgi:hypothetical protein
LCGQENGFAGEEIDTPQAVLGVGKECQPGGSVRAGGAGTIVFCQHTANDVFVELDADRMGYLLGDEHATETRIAPLDLDDGGDEFRRGAFWPRLAAMP